MPAGTAVAEEQPTGSAAPPGPAVAASASGAAAGTPRAAGSAVTPGSAGAPQQCVAAGPTGTSRTAIACGEVNAKGGAASTALAAVATGPGVTE
ncbi:Uncharacterised protein [Mycobacterium tuberculosis]|nr:Uncharacterised protein [Mycobacterium tuberculosis]CML46334.1 Uncharacterised protein [Mycobacterium tuberculosis]CMP42539.1 Uncharacterised protein [Mycobacterium tuberculosis]CMR07561.1 Uncharacterised protein [Mycobacterium tuberculosis]CMS87814.1 Uncharacterised protein [Mycobacterium tuberculosis]